MTDHTLRPAADSHKHVQDDRGRAFARHGNRGR
jgi:hypothetical protein